MRLREMRKTWTMHLKNDTLIELTRIFRLDLATMSDFMQKICKIGFFKNA